MKKGMLSLLALSVVVLSACASHSSAGPHSRSGVQVYGTVNAGVGHTRQTTTFGDGSKVARTRSGMRSY